MALGILDTPWCLFWCSWYFLAIDSFTENVAQWTESTSILSGWIIGIKFVIAESVLLNNNLTGDKSMDPWHKYRFQCQLESLILMWSQVRERITDNIAPVEFMSVEMQWCLLSWYIYQWTHGPQQGYMKASGLSTEFPVEIRISDINVIFSASSEHLPQYNVKCQYRP